MSTAEAPHKPYSMDELVALCKRRGFIFPASEIYGGINGFWDFGPLGVELRNNLRDAWWHDMVRCPPHGPDGKPLSIVGVDTAIVQNPKIWEASGHVAGFNDPMLDCRESKRRYRADHLLVFRHREDTSVPMVADDAPSPTTARRASLIAASTSCRATSATPFNRSGLVPQKSASQSL